MKPKRSLPLSLKSTRSKKKARSIKMFLEKNLSGTLGRKDQLDFCPVCQVPFRILIGLSVESHVQECVANYSESSGMVKFISYTILIARPLEPRGVSAMGERIDTPTVQRWLADLLATMMIK